MSNFSELKEKQLFQSVCVSWNVTKLFLSPALIKKKIFQWQWSIWLWLAAADRWQQRDLITLMASSFPQAFFLLPCVEKNGLFQNNEQDLFYLQMIHIKTIKLHLNHMCASSNLPELLGSIQFGSEKKKEHYWNFPVYIILSLETQLLGCCKQINQTGYGSLILAFQSYNSQRLF